MTQMTQIDRFPLHTALFRANYQEVKRLLCEGNCNVNEYNAEGYTPLHIAVTISSNSDIVHILINYGAAVNMKSHYGFTPLETVFAMYPIYRSLQVTLMLVQAGAKCINNEGIMQLPSSKWETFMFRNCSCEDIYRFISYGFQFRLPVSEIITLRQTSHCSSCHSGPEVSGNILNNKPGHTHGVGICNNTSNLIMRMHEVALLSTLSANKIRQTLVPNAEFCLQNSDLPTIITKQILGKCN
jgi:hypothetical protein